MRTCDSPLISQRADRNRSSSFLLFSSISLPLLLDGPGRYRIRPAPVFFFFSLFLKIEGHYLKLCRRGSAFPPLMIPFRIPGCSPQHLRAYLSFGAIKGTLFNATSTGRNAACPDPRIVVDFLFFFSKRGLLLSSPPTTAHDDNFSGRELNAAGLFSSNIFFRLLCRQFSRAFSK